MTQENDRCTMGRRDKYAKASVDTGTCYVVKKYTEIVFRKHRKIKEEELTVLEEKMNVLDPDKSKTYKFFWCGQEDKVGVKRVVERAKKAKRLRKSLEYLMRLKINDQNLMKAINFRVMSVASNVMNACNLGKGDLDELDMIAKSVLMRGRIGGRQSSSY